jgi:hypothetical protein
MSILKEYEAMKKRRAERDIFMSTRKKPGMDSQVFIIALSFFGFLICAWLYLNKYL